MNEFYTISGKRKRKIPSWSLNTYLILINVLLFFVFLFLVDIFRVFSIDYVAIKPANIFEGKYLWTFLTSMFMHGGFFHLFVNMLSLFFVGGLVEKILGRVRYLRIYLWSGIFSGFLFVVSSVFLKSDFNSYAVGASGAIFGLIGVLMLLTPNLPVYMLFIPVPVKMKYAAPIMLIILWFFSVVADIPIGNVAHIGGLIAGVFYGIYLRFRYKNKTKMIQNYFR